MSIDLSVEMFPVISSNVKEAGYTLETRELFVKFRNDSVYRYDNVPEQTYQKLLDAESFGKALNQLVKNQFDYVKIS